MRVIFLCFLMFNIQVLQAYEIPKGGNKDRRITFVNYDADQVVKINSAEGYSVHIQFALKEKIKIVGLGDPSAWDIGILDNHLFLKPIADDPNTNMTVLTDYRSYNFDLHSMSVENSLAKKMLFQLTFKYPKEKAAKLKIENLKNQAKAQIIVLNKKNARIKAAKAKTLKERLNNKAVFVSNSNYWVAGFESISPIKVLDDNRYTYLTFSNGYDIPAPYIVNEDKTESLINFHMKDGNVMVLQRVEPKWVLRLGNRVACLENRSFTFERKDNKSGSTIPTIKRILKKEF